MRRSTLTCLLAFLLAVQSAAAIELSPGQEASREDLTPDMKAKALASSFEVVVPRPDEKGMTYEKELPWDLVPFQIRNDKFYSIGTAFAVSKTELVTAFHVLELGSVSRTFPTYFIRDATGSVFELDQITGSDQHRDAVRFTVKGRVFDSWLDLNPEFALNHAVFSVGNALGEGNVLRRGDLIGTVPEVVDGQWKLLKSSADVNGGNSGGPLLDLQGRVIGVVVQRNDNISLSLPVAELVKLSHDSAAFFNKFFMAFALIPEQSPAKTLEFDLPLPAQYQKLKGQAADITEKFYDREMEAFLEQQNPGLFPNGTSSQEAILQNLETVTPQVYVKSKETRRWSLSDAEFKYSDLGDNGHLRILPFSGLILGRMDLPDGVTVDATVHDPKTFMDLIYKGLNIERPIGSQKVRITSIGQPFSQAKIKDRWGRVWFQSCWLNPVDDAVILAYAAPIPGGFAFLVYQARSSYRYEAEFDLGRILNFIYVPYAGRIKDWEQLMKFPDLLPESFKDLKLQIDVGESLRLESPWISLALEQKDWPIESNGWLNLGMGFKSIGGQAVWSLRRLEMAQDQNADFFTVLNHLKPYPAMDDGWVNSWRTVATSLHPYNGQVFSEDGNSVIAMLFPSFTGESLQADSLYTLYLSRPGAVTPSKATEDIGVLAAHIRVPAAPTAPAARQPPP